MRYAIHWCIFRQVTEWNEKWNVFCTIFTSWVWRSKNFLERACDCTFNIMKRRNNMTLKGFDVRNRSTMDKLMYNLHSFLPALLLFFKLFLHLARIYIHMHKDTSISVWYTTETKCQRAFILVETHQPIRRTNFPSKKTRELRPRSDTIISNGLDNKRTENALKSRRLLLRPPFSLSSQDVATRWNQRLPQIRFHLVGKFAETLPSNIGTRTRLCVRRPENGTREIRWLELFM